MMDRNTLNECEIPILNGGIQSRRHCCSEKTCPLKTQGTAFAHAPCPEIQKNICFDLAGASNSEEISFTACCTAPGKSRQLETSLAGVLSCSGLNSQGLIKIGARQH